MAAARHSYSHFVIVSDDAGYLPLVSGLKEYGHKVTVVKLLSKGSLVTEAAHGWLQLSGRQKEAAHQCVAPPVATAVASAPAPSPTTPKQVRCLSPRSHDMFRSTFMIFHRC